MTTRLRVLLNTSLHRHYCFLLCISAYCLLSPKHKFLRVVLQLPVTNEATSHRQQWFGKFSLVGIHFSYARFVRNAVQTAHQ